MQFKPMLVEGQPYYLLSPGPRTKSEQTPFYLGGKQNTDLPTPPA